MRKQDNMRSKSWWFNAALLFVLVLLSLQGCATNFRGDLRFARLVPSEERHTAEYSATGTVRQSAQKDMSFERPSYERKSSPPGRSSPYPDADRPSNSPVSPNSVSHSDRTFGELFSGPLVGFVAGSLPLLWSHPFIWMGAMALAVLIEPTVLEYARQASLAPWFQ